jgi:predicted nucleic acid-binding protein
MIPADERHFLDAGIFIGAILLGDSRHSEAYPLVEAARRGDFRSCTSVGVLSEVYGFLTWTGSVTPHAPADAARSVRESSWNLRLPSKCCKTGSKSVSFIYSWQSAIT